MFERLLHWFWKQTKLEIDCDYYCVTCPRYKACCRRLENTPGDTPYHSHYAA